MVKPQSHRARITSGLSRQCTGTVRDLIRSDAVVMPAWSEVVRGSPGLSWSVLDIPGGRPGSFWRSKTTGAIREIFFILDNPTPSGATPGRSVAMPGLSGTVREMSGAVRENPGVAKNVCCSPDDAVNATDGPGIATDLTGVAPDMPRIEPGSAGAVRGSAGMVTSSAGPVRLNPGLGRADPPQFGALPGLGRVSPGLRRDLAKSGAKNLKTSRMTPDYITR